MKTVGELAQEFRIAKGWTTAQMGAACGTKRQNIEQLEAAGDRLPQYIKQLAKVMGTTTDALLSGEIKPAPTQGLRFSVEAVTLALLFDQLAEADRAELHTRCTQLINDRIIESKSQRSGKPVRADAPRKQSV